MRLERLERLKLEATFWLGRRLPTCQEVLPVLSQSLERPLTLRERVTLRLHFLICVYCIRYVKQLRFMRDALRAQSVKILEGDAPSSPSLSQEARERIRLNLQNK